MDGIEQTAEGWWIISDDSHIGKWVKECKRLDHDQWLLQKLCHYVRPGDMIVDVGANIGDHTIAYLDWVAEHGEVHAFEVGDKAFECLSRNCNPYRFPQCYLHNVALYNRKCRLSFYQVGNNVGSTYVEMQRDLKAIVVDAVPMDNFGFERLDFLKIDAEGAEPLILEGAKETIKRFHPIICMEVNTTCLNRAGSSEAELLEMMKHFGYWYFVLQGQRNQPTDDPENAQYDILARWKA